MNEKNINQFIRSIKLNKDKVKSFNEYPFNLPVIKYLDKLKFHPNVTFIVGENGSGKSTILEAIATSYGFNPEGGTKNFNFSTNDTHSCLYDFITLVKGVKKPKDGFFLRAESFYNVATNIDELAREIPGNFLERYGGKSLHEISHGESFFALIINKFTGNSIYILDEPEAALSPIRQMSLISRIDQLVKQGSQFIIATHSPILMAYPNSFIYEIKDNIELVEYEESENYKITKDFLNNYKKMIHILTK
ncbi:AAA family ATPase [Intestinibacter bartlettii]|uniref:AAA family ATPase n=1 Tax=Intestinibacter bartlettii TaxID=261299 RepID=A0ABS6DXI8_9FIRM|nr:AAA family ATPase [Intestinibacter bartlettii]MBU5336561.1 AAA family ATPase [Intestinibacter bartlettii]MDO5010353.1 AAA family ATPase [Intestinibacter bartlettii]